MSKKGKQNEADKNPNKIKTALASITGQEATLLSNQYELSHIAGEMDLNYQMWKWELDRHFVPTEQFHTWKGIVSKTPSFSWTLGELPQDPWRKWSSRERFCRLGLSVKLEQLERKPHEVGIELFSTIFSEMIPKPKLFVVLRAINGKKSKDRVATKIFGYGEMLKDEPTRYFQCATFPKTLLVHPDYNSKNFVTLDFYQEQQWATHFVQSYGGDLFWTIENFPNLIQILKDPNMQLFSPYFYTAPGPLGYRVQAIISRAGIYVLVRIVFLTGKFDQDKKKKIHYDYTINISTPDCTIWLGQYERQNVRALKLYHYLGHPEEMSKYNAICLKLQVYMK